MALTKISRGLLSTGISDSSDATAITIDSSENVGIGTTSPFSKTQITETGWSSGAPYGTVLTVTGNDTNDANWGHLIITDSSTGTGNGGMLRFAVGSTSSDISPHAGIDGFTEGSNYGGLKFLTRANGGTATERMRIDSSGTLIVNRTDKPNAGEAVAVSRNGIAIARGTSSGEYRLMYGNDSSSMILYFSNGSNQAQLSAAGAWVDASDVAYKKDIVDINYGLDTVKKLKPRTYKMKPNDEQQIGFVAQELELDIPEIVNGEDGSKGVAYGQLTAVLTKAIQEQQTQIEALQSEINTLKGGD